LLSFAGLAYVFHDAFEKFSKKLIRSQSGDLAEK
jgi:hypothetical protein